MPLQIINVCLFFLYTFGLGYAATMFWKEHNLETTVMRVGAGLGVFPVLGVLLSLLRIPLDWKIFLGLALLGPLVSARRCISKRNFSLGFRRGEPFYAIGILLILFAFHSVVYCKGPFVYPWLEDDDSWGHAAGIKYVSIEKNISVPPGEFHYINPYPPGYDLLFGVLHQTYPSLYWTLKFFNGFIIALGFLFFYFFAKAFTGSREKSLLATFFLSCIPSYLSHFIWAHALVATLFFPAMYFFSKTETDSRFIIPASLVMAGMLMSQPTESFKLLAMIIFFWLLRMLISKHWEKKGFITILLSGLIALLWWGPIVKQTLEGSSKILVRTGKHMSQTRETQNVMTSIFSPASGTATHSYTIRSYLFVPEDNYINLPTGIGNMLCLLTVIGVLVCLRKVRSAVIPVKIYYLTILFWLGFTFLGMNSKTFHLPVGLFAFRFWTLFAIPVALLSSEATLSIIHWIDRPLVKGCALLCILVYVFRSAGYYKWEINTRSWPYGVVWASRSEVKGYVWLRDHLPPNTKVFTFTENLLVIGHDMYADFWREEYKRAFQNAFALSVEELHANLKQNHFAYIVIGQREVKKFGLPAVNAKCAEFYDSGLFEFIPSRKGVKVFKVL